MSLNPLVWLSLRINKLRRTYVQVIVLAVSLIFYYLEARGAFVVVKYGYERMPWLYVLFVTAFGGLLVFAFLAHVRLLRIGPGHVLPGQILPASVTVWDECNVCHARRPLGTHHCRVCDVCVLMRDHHCPWVNGCVGQGNQWLFILFSTYVLLGSALCSLFLVEHLMHQSCASCPFPETKTPAVTSLMITVFCALAAAGIDSTQVVSIGARAREYTIQYKAKQANLTAEDAQAAAGEDKVKERQREDMLAELRGWRTATGEIRGDPLTGWTIILSLTPFWVRRDPLTHGVATV